MSVESIQAGKLLPNIAPKIINHERRPKPHQNELWTLFFAVGLLFCVFLILPLTLVVITSLQTGDGTATLANYTSVLSESGFLESLVNSVKVSAAAAAMAVIFAFWLSYTANCNLPHGMKKRSPCSRSFRCCCRPSPTVSRLFIRWASRV